MLAKAIKFGLVVTLYSKDYVKTVQIGAHGQCYVSE